MRLFRSVIFSGLIASILSFSISQAAQAGMVRVILQDIECIKKNESGLDEIYAFLESGSRSSIYSFDGGYKTINYQVFYADDRAGRWEGVSLMESDAGESFRWGDDLLGWIKIEAIGGQLIFHPYGAGNPVMNYQNQTYTVDFTRDDAFYRVTFHYWWD